MHIKITNGAGYDLLTLDTDETLPLGNLYFVLPDGRDFSLYFDGSTVTLGAYQEGTEDLEEGWREAEGGLLDMESLPKNAHTAWTPATEDESKGAGL